MKKIISINLSGRVIPIEDSAYENLQRYIESLRRYFANEDGRDEIINDIESRIAELMNDKVKKGAAAVTEANIEEIISSMGRIEDFEQADTSDAASGVGNTSSNQSAYLQTEQKRIRGRLYRDTLDKMLGGVCSGLANYFNIDPAIVRILFVILTFGAGMSIFVYILLWIFVPARSLQPTAGKRFFRNPDDRILGGVAGGIAAYINRDAWIIRLIFAAPLLLNIVFGVFNGLFFAFHRDIFPNFVIGSFTGTFVVSYIILWIILPEARTTYDKMEMRGEPIDVNSIRQNVQEGMSDFKKRAQAWGEEVKTTAQDLGSRASEFANTRGRTFASEVGQATRPVANGCGHAIGVLFKAFFLFIAGIIAFILFVVVLAFTIGGVARPFNDFLLNGFWQNASLWGTLIFFLAVPLIAIITWIVRRLMKVRSQNRYLGWMFGALWTLGWVSLILFIASMAKDWRSYNSVSDEVTLAQPAMNRMIIKVVEPAIQYSGSFSWIEDDGDGEGFDLTEDSLKIANIKIRVDKSKDSNYHVTLSRYSAGRNRGDAGQRAQKIVYNVSSLDSALLLGSGYGIGKGDKFRGQKVLVEIEVPVGRRIRFDETVLEKLNPIKVIKEKIDFRQYRRNWNRDWDYGNNFDWKTGVDFIMTESGDLVDAEQPLNKEGTQEEEENSDVYEYKRDSAERNNEIEEQRRRVEEETERLKELQRNRRNRNTTFIDKEAKSGDDIIAQMPTPIFSVII